MIGTVLPPLQSHSLTIVIPAHNEKNNIPILLNKLKNTYEGQFKFLPKTLIIDDGSNDGTDSVLKDLSSKYPFYKVIHHPKQKGLTEVLKTILEHTNTEWLFFIPADLESDPGEDLMPLLVKAEQGWDAVTGWRRNRRGLRKYISYTGNTIVRAIFNVKIHDINWIKLIRRDALFKIPLKSNYYRYMIPMLSALGYSTSEVKTNWHPRSFGITRFNFFWLITSIFDFFKIWLMIKCSKTFYGKSLYVI